MINKAINKVILTILCIVLVISTSPFVSLGNEENDFYAQYSGSTSAGWGYTPNCTFTINKIAGNRFRGTFSAQNIDKYSFTENVSGIVTSNEEKFTCYFRVNFYNNRYYSNIIATIDKLNGTCECFCSGSWHMEDFIMTGTKFTYFIDFGVSSEFDSYSENEENDMKMCMVLSF